MSTTNTIHIRSVCKEDVEGLKEVLLSSELFPAEYLDDMLSDYVTNPETDEICFASLSGSQIIGFGYCKPETFADGTYNLLAIALRKEQQGKGIGKKMIRYLEDLLIAKSQRILIVETSSDPQFELTRRFYRNLHYTEEATIRDFWKENEHKIIFWKKLLQTPHNPV